MSKLVKDTFSNMQTKVFEIARTENTYFMDKEKNKTNPLKYDDFSSYGLSQAGVKLGFPSKFLETLSTDGHTELADEILKTRLDDFFMKKDSPLLIRDFCDMHYGVLSDKYSIFDDSEIVDIISQVPYLMDAEEIWTNISPEQFHARFISKNKITLNGDDSPLSMAVFIDNSMVGKSSFTVRFGIYRWACTNGMITGLKEFQILRQVHKGKDTKEFAQIVNEALSNVQSYEKMLMDMVENMIATKSAIYEMSEEDALRYIKDKLTVGKKTAGKIIDMYQAYGGKSKWDLCNAITDYAHQLDFDTRLRFERLSSLVA